VNDSGPPFSALGLCWCGGGRPWGSGVRLAMKTLPVGFLALTEGFLPLLGRIRFEVPQGAKHRSTTTLRRYDAHLYFG
jgi:hypothetical protein